MTSLQVPEARTARHALAAALCLACVVLQGCSRSNPQPPPDILKAQREALEKAKGMDKVLQDEAQRRGAEPESQQK